LKKDNEIIKIGLMIDSDETPLWTNLMIEEILKFVEISLIIIDNSKKEIEERKILFDWYLKYEGKRFTPKKKSKPQSKI
tara:strand:- start:472 stop:708 length:237 start_codon:yes stop_codon:yes gene_type:complete